MEAHIYIETWLERWPEKGDHFNRWPSFNRWCDFIVAIERLAHTCGEKGLIMMYSTWNVHPLHHVVQFVCVYLCCSLQLTLVCHWIVFAIYDDADDNTVCIFQAHIESPVLCSLITNCVPLTSFIVLLPQTDFASLPPPSAVLRRSLHEGTISSASTFSVPVCHYNK